MILYEILSYDNQISSITKKDDLFSDRLISIPLVKVNKTTYSYGKTGPITKKIRARYWEWVELPNFSTPISYG